MDISTLKARVVFVALAMAAVVALAACASSETENPPAAQNSAISNSAGELVVYSGRSESLVGPIIEQFADATGIEVSVKYGSTSEMAATILEEGDNSPADVFFAQDPGGLGAVAKAGRFADIPQDILDMAPAWARSPESKWVGISGRARVLAYNTNGLTEADLPGDVFDLIDPKWKGRIGWAPGNGSFQAMVTAMRVMWGEDRTRQWLEGMKANEPKLFDGNSPQVQAAASGEIDLGLVNHYYLYRFLQEEGEGFPARNYHPSAGGPGSLVMVAGAGILSTAENRENAERFLRFMLSKVAQQYFAGQTFEYPLVEGVNTNRLLTPIDQINRPDIDMAALDDLEGTQRLLREVGILE